MWILLGWCYHSFSFISFSFTQTIPSITMRTLHITFKNMGVFCRFLNKIIFKWWIELSFRKKMDKLTNKIFLIWSWKPVIFHRIKWLKNFASLERSLENIENIRRLKSDWYSFLRDYFFWIHFICNSDLLMALNSFHSVSIFTYYIISLYSFPCPFVVFP